MTPASSARSRAWVVVSLVRTSTGRNPSSGRTRRTEVEHLVAVDVRHVEVHQDDVGQDLEAAIDGAAGVGDGVDARRPGHPQDEFEVLNVRLDVVDDQHAVDGRWDPSARVMIRAPSGQAR